MTMAELVSRHPEWTDRVHVEAWLALIAREAGDYAASALADFGARIDDNGEADVSHLPDDHVSAIKQSAMVRA